ncbi:hypothetical protein B0A49_02886 [Cryomyces minteri]|uniref:Uncharacterized protein n=1 Tax=Cryomyces minteri TaxID=331657 RepID=A0A4U0X7R7_9PEZI|nr:hypothetical protein B0A49_02886 [Cryomyces minteri]
MTVIREMLDKSFAAPCPPKLVSRHKQHNMLSPPDKEQCPPPSHLRQEATSPAETATSTSAPASPAALQTMTDDESGTAPTRAETGIPEI